MHTQGCKRPACKSTLPSTITGSSCCDESCLVEIARRDCSHDHDTALPSREDERPCASHYLKARDTYGTILDTLGCICRVLEGLGVESCCVATGSGVRSLRERSSRSRSVKSARSACSGRKEKRAGSCEGDSCCGTAEKETVSVQDEDDDCEKSCCGAGPSVVLPASKLATFAGEEKNCCEKSCCDSASETSSIEADDCRGKSCCDSPPSELQSGHCQSKLTASVDQKGSDDCSKDCCSDTTEKLPNASTIPGKKSFEAKKTDDCHKSCCGENQAPVAAPKNDDGARGCCDSSPSKAKQDVCVGSGAKDNTAMKSCCAGQSGNPGSVATLKEVKGCSGQSCCADNTSRSSCELGIVKAEECSEMDCCGNEPLPSAGNLGCAVKGAEIRKDTCCKDPSESTAPSCCEKACCTGDQPTREKSDDDLRLSAHGEKITAIARSTPFSGNSNKDLESGAFQLEHVVLSVQGMTCTGCEKKLYRSLNVLPTISNIKTSLLLGQAEFDLSMSSTGVDLVSTIKTLERMTGFTCAKMTQSGHILDLVVDEPAEDFTTKDLPFGVSDLTILDKQTIRVTYHPELVGARDLLPDPFFRSAKLAPAAAPPMIASGRAHVRMMLFKTILSSLLTIPVLVLAWAPIEQHAVLYGAISLALATIIQIYIVGPFYNDALKALIFSRMIEMDLLIVISTTTAYVYSIIAYAFLASGKPLSTGSFFETSTLLATLIMVGRLVTAFARQRAVESISIESLQATTALLVDPHTHQEKEIDVRLLQYKDLFKVLPDTSIVTDGTVIAGETEVDESMITGEATLVAKKPGSPVIAGSINYSGTLTIRLTRLPGENTIKTIGSMVDEAKSSKARIQQTADRVAGYFVPVILVITVLVFVVWVAVGKTVRNLDATTTCIDAMTYAISALIISCPCAIGLAVPMVLVMAGGVAAKHGLIFKSAETIEIARNVSHVIFDKTGTLTQGKLSVEIEEYPTGQADILAPMLLALTSQSKHPVSIAIATHLKQMGIQPSTVKKLVSVAGNGIQATWNENIIRAGNPFWLGAENSPIVQRILPLGLTMFCVSMNGELVAVFGLKDVLRPDAIEVINQLKERSIEVSIVSGDMKQSVMSIAGALNVPESHVRSRCSPADKQTYVKQMLLKPKSIVLFCGDGTNDAVALAQASIGMHIDGGTDIAQSAADAVLVRPALTGILILMDLSKASFRRIAFNFVWSFVYNTFAILLAAGAFPHARIQPAFAGLGEIVSVLPVIAVAMQLRWATF